MSVKKEDPTEALLRALRHPLRRELLRRYVAATQPLSPKELAAQTKLPLSNVSYHVRELARFGAVDEVPWARGTLALQPEQKGNDTEAKPRTEDDEAPADN